MSKAHRRSGEMREAMISARANKELDAMRAIDAFYERHPGQLERSPHEVAAFIRGLPDHERIPLEEATSTLARSAAALFRQTKGEA
jgi:hypothetical protein